MKSIGLAACLFLLLPLAGCGSGDSPQFSLTCTLHRLPSGAIRAAVTVSNSTSTIANAYIYGPALTWVQYIHPVLDPAEVVVQVANQRPQPYRGFRVPAVSPNTPMHLDLEFRPPPGSRPLAVTGVQTFKANDLSVVTGSDCRVKP